MRPSCWTLGPKCTTASTRPELGYGNGWHGAGRWPWKHWSPTWWRSSISIARPPSGTSTSSSPPSGRETWSTCMTDRGRARAQAAMRLLRDWPAAVEVLLIYGAHYRRVDRRPLEDLLAPGALHRRMMW